MWSLECNKCEIEERKDRHHVYESVLWKIFVFEEQIKGLINLCIQFPNCVLYVDMGYIVS